MHHDQPKRAATSLQEHLRSGRFVITAEITPPVSTSADDLFAKALPLRGLADGVNVTDGAGARAHMSSVASAALLLESGIEPIVQFTCRDRNRIALQGDLMGAGALGIRNFLFLRGDDPKAGDQPDAKPVFDLESRQLLETAVAIRDRGELLHGRKVGGKAQFFLGAADAPLDPPADWKPNSLKAKIASGAQFAQTQFCMDSAVLRRYMQRLADEGLAGKLYFLIGIAPLRTAKSAEWMRKNLFGTIIADSIVRRMEGATNAEAEGKKIAVELMQEFAEIPGVSGVHIMAPNHDRAIPEVIEMANGVLARRKDASRPKTAAQAHAVTPAHILWEQ
jgi:methylenetetrahydrofolate reductase (NADPH)